LNYPPKPICIKALREILRSFRNGPAESAVLPLNYSPKLALHQSVTRDFQIGQARPRHLCRPRAASGG